MINSIYGFPRHPKQKRTKLKQTNKNHHRLSQKWKDKTCKNICNAYHWQQATVPNTWSSQKLRRKRHIANINMGKGQNKIIHIKKMQLVLTHRRCLDCLRIGETQIKIEITEISVLTYQTGTPHPPKNFWCHTSADEIVGKQVILCIADGRTK